MKRLFYIFISLYLFSPTWTYGTENGGERWLSYFKDVDSNNHFLDRQTVGHYSDGIASVWEKLVYGKPKDDGTTAIGSHMEINCSLNKWRTLIILSYDSQGRTKEIEPRPSPWLDVPPESPVEHVSTLLCKTERLPEENWLKLVQRGSDTMYIDNKNVSHFSDGDISIWTKLVHGDTQKNGTAYSLTLMEINCNANKYKALWTGPYDSQGHITDIPLGSDLLWHDVQPMSLPAAISQVHCQ